MGGRACNFATDLGWAVKNLIIGAPRNWSRTYWSGTWLLIPAITLIRWAAAGIAWGPTVSSTVTRNVSYYIIAHAAKFGPAGVGAAWTRIYRATAECGLCRPDGKSADRIK